MITTELCIKVRWYECNVLPKAKAQSLAWILMFGLLSIFHLPLQVHSPLLQKQEADIYGFHQGILLIPDFLLCTHKGRLLQKGRRQEGSEIRVLLL